MGRATLRGDVDHVNFRQSIFIRSPLRLVGAALSRRLVTPDSESHPPGDRKPDLSSSCPPEMRCLTRRVKAKSARHAVVVRFSKSRRRYERQGLLVEPQALTEAQRELAPQAR